MNRKKNSTNLGISNFFFIKNNIVKIINGINDNPLKLGNKPKQILGNPNKKPRNI
ncbi:hypothetical protein GCM10027291_32090 [Telluribacter humicola]